MKAGIPGMETVLVWEGISWRSVLVPYQQLPHCYEWLWKYQNDGRSNHLPFYK